MIDQHYLDLYPCLTSYWTDRGYGFGEIRFELPITCSTPKTLSARMYIVQGVNCATVHVEVKHRIYGTAKKDLGSAEQNASIVWDAAFEAISELEVEALKSFQTWCAEQDAKELQKSRKP